MKNCIHSSVNFIRITLSQSNYLFWPTKSFRKFRSLNEVAKPRRSCMPFTCDSIILLINDIANCVVNLLNCISRPALCFLSLWGKLRRTLNWNISLLGSHWTSNTLWVFALSSVFSKSVSTGTSATSLTFLWFWDMHHSFILKSPFSMSRFTPDTTYSASAWLLKL